MKASKYNVIFDCAEKKYIFNTMTCALAEIDNKIALELDKLTNLNFTAKKECISEYMRNAGFIINDDVDELTLLKYKHYKSKSPNAFSVIIAPTMLCNFECPYCYESSDNKFIKNEVKEALYKKIDDLLVKGKKIYLSWFGGEPLLAKNVIWEMSDKLNKLCKRYNTECVYNIVTNGYLLNRPTISKLLNLGIRHAQITIDGIPEIHNKRRKLKGSSSDTFYRIVKNIKIGLDMGMNFRIRVNVDKINAFCLEHLLKILAKEGLQDCFINLERVRCYTKSETNKTLNAKEYGELLIDFSRQLKENGFKYYGGLCYPFTAFSMCAATVENYLIVDPNGYLYRCSVEIGRIKNSYGNILNDPKKIDESVNNLKYLTIDPFSRSECTKCKVLPLCTGGCAYYTLKNKNELDCSHWKYNLANKLSKVCKIIQ